MMSKKQLTCMLTLHIIYLFLGASIFYHIESPLEMDARREEQLERIEIQNLLYENSIPSDPDKQDSILRKLSDFCGKSMFNETGDELETPIKWDFYHSFFFSYTVVSTIGYGNLAPTAHLSRILMIFYGLFGIPINGILLANLGEYFGLQVIKIYRKYKRRDGKSADRLSYIFHNLGMLGQIALYLIPGFLFFMILPACIFVVFEGWDYVAAIYYAFVTLTTIGFGDIVAGTINNGFAPGYFIAYQIFLIVWITFGLGYIVMLLGFITSGMRSERVHKLEQKLANQFKSTQNRILQGFSRDMNVIRKIINEANLIKLKPVYVEVPAIPRSVSCPEFTFDVEPRGPIFKRKRANSENIHLTARDMLRIQSDTDLLGIDKEKTFTASAIVKPAELLARVVNVLGGFEDPAQKGVNMFRDDEILASEKPNMWSIGQDVIVTDSPFLNKRNRALSVAVPNYRKESLSNMPHDFTWTNGDTEDKYKNNINGRAGKLSLPMPDLSSVVQQNTYDSPKTLFSKLFRKQSSVEDTKVTTESVNLPDEHISNKAKPRRGSIFPTFDFNPSEDDMAKAYKEKTKRGRHSIFPTFDFNADDDDDDEAKKAKAYKDKTKRGRHSIFPTFDFNADDDDDEEERERKAYREKTKRGRHSIFPTFDFSEDDHEANLYKEKTKRGRHSIFPTFNFDEDSDEERAKSYKESTKKGRKSLFPTFNFNDSDKNKDDDSINEDEVKDYQNRTKKGRTSLFPTFGKSKKSTSDDDALPEMSDDIKNYQNKTKKGRLSLFPTFGKNRSNDEEEGGGTSDLAASIKEYQRMTNCGRSSLLSNDIENYRQSTAGGRKSSVSDLEAYKNKTKRGRLSLFDPDVNVSELPEQDQVEVLEHTSVADLLRALALLETASPQQGNGLAAGAPTLANLISKGIGGAAIGGSEAQVGTRRRGSVRPDLNLPSKSELDEILSGPRRRRVSRTSAPQFTPTLATVVAGAELQTTAKAARENRMSMLNNAPSTESEDKEEVAPRIRRYSPAPGGPAKTGAGPVPRLFSRIRKESAPGLVEESSRRGSLTDIVIDKNKDNT